jgi:hypothetical protein
MASTIKRRVALKGQSRSKFCGEPIKRGSKTPCLRLAGHKKAHRATTLRVGKSVAVVAEPTVTVLPDAGAEGRDVQVQRSAKRGKAAPKGTQLTPSEAPPARRARPAKQAAS